MPQLMSFFIAFWTYHPWIAIGLMAARAWRRRRESKHSFPAALRRCNFAADKDGAIGWRAIRV